MRTKLLILQLLCCLACFGQQKLKKADRLFDEMAYVAAVDAYESYLEKNKPSVETSAKIADSYYFTCNYNKAASWYAKLQTQPKEIFTDARFNRYIQSLRILEKYTEADKRIEDRLRANNDIAGLERFTRQKKQLDSVLQLKPQFTIINLPSNSNKADFGTAFYGLQVVYSSAKDTAKIGGKTYSYNNQPFLELYVADRNQQDGQLYNEQRFIPNDKNSYHNATVAFMPDTHIMYYSANTIKPSGKLINSVAGTNNIGILKGFVEEDRIRDAQPISFNSTEYSVAHPAVTDDGKWLFFTSDMPGGYGETDIYVSEILADGTLAPYQNLGPVINTSGKEMFPFIKDMVLYFSSDGHYGLGGLDVFESKRTGILEFSEPVHLGKPVNSNLDDFAFIADAEMAYGYFSSNRAGGKGDDDIYAFTKKTECKQLVSGSIIHKKTQLPLKGAKVKATDEAGAVTASAEADEKGYYSFKLPCNIVVIIEASEENYTSEKSEVALSLKPEPRKVDFELTAYADLIVKQGNEEKVDINPVYFDFDKWDITPQAAIELDKVVYVMANFPDIVIKIESHTDSRGNDAYNLKLSDNRAKATYDYILSKGIAASRIESVAGYGETRHINRCSNGVECSEEEHLLNRRSDFIVVKKQATD